MSPSGTKDGENFHGKAKKIQGAWLQALAPENLGKMLLSKLKKKTANHFIKSSQLFFFESEKQKFSIHGKCCHKLHPKLFEKESNFEASILKLEVKYLNDSGIKKISCAKLLPIETFKVQNCPKYQTKSLSLDKSSCL